jgi:hypothetical protein
MGQRPNWVAIVSLVCGITALLGACCCWPIGIVIAVAGIVCGVLGLGSEARGIAIGGLLTNAIALLFALANFGYTMYVMQSGQHPMFPDGFGPPTMPGQSAPVSPDLAPDPLAPDPLAPDPLAPNPSSPGPSSAAQPEGAQPEGAQPEGTDPPPAAAP